MLVHRSTKLIAGGHGQAKLSPTFALSFHGANAHGKVQVKQDRRESSSCCPRGRIMGGGRGCQQESGTASIGILQDESYAFLIDALLMLGVTAILTLPELFPFLLGDPFGLNFGAVPFATLGLLFVYSTLLEGFYGQTLGKRVAGLNVVRLDGKKVGYEHSVVWNFGKTFLLPFDLLVEIRHENCLRYFDKFAGTTVIDLRAPLKPLPVSVAKTCEEDLAVAS
jgi:uncharacterized RDD family membrane protein YckC